MVQMVEGRGTLGRSGLRSSAYDSLKVAASLRFSPVCSSYTVSDMPRSTETSCSTCVAVVHSMFKRLQCRLNDLIPYVG